MPGGALGTGCVILNHTGEVHPQGVDSSVGKRLGEMTSKPVNNITLIMVPAKVETPIMVP